MSGKELLRKLAEGEKDLRRVRTIEGCNLFQLEDYDSVINSLRSRPFGDFRENPYDLSFSNLRGLVAPRMFLPYVKARGVVLMDANLTRAGLRGANLRRANLWRTNLWGAGLEGANLWGANLNGADLEGANLWGANLWGANLNGADLTEADLRGAIDLMETSNLGYAHFKDAIVGEEERRICQEAYDKASHPLFNVVQ